MRRRLLVLGGAVVTAIVFEACLVGPCPCGFGNDSGTDYSYDVQPADVPWLFGDTSFSDAATTDAPGDADGGMSDADDGSADADDGNADADDGGG